MTPSPAAPARGAGRSFTEHPNLLTTPEATTSVFGALADFGGLPPTLDDVGSLSGRNGQDITVAFSGSGASRPCRSRARSYR